MARLWKKGDAYSDSFFSFGKEENQAILYVRNIWKNEYIHVPPELFSLEYLAGKNISEIKIQDDWFWLMPNSKGKEGSALLLLTDRTYKGVMNPEKTFHSSLAQNVMKSYLLEDEIYDFSSDEVQKVAKKIIKELPFEKEYNPYWQALAALRFAYKDIEYSRATKEAVEKLETTIRAFPNDKISSLMIRSFLKEEILMKKDPLERLCSGIVVPEEIQEPRLKAIYILNEFDAQNPVFIVKWPFGKGLSASRTIHDSMGKCDCLTHVFVALCRGMGIPAVGVCGNYGSFGLHSWAVVYIHPYGLVEVDPTNTFDFCQFDHGLYFHHFLRNQFRANIDFLNLKKTITPDKIEICKSYYKQSLKEPSLEDLLSEVEK